MVSSSETSRSLENFPFSDGSTLPAVLRERSLERLVGRGVEEDEPNLGDARGRRADRTDGDWRRELQRVAVDAGGDGGKGDGPAPECVGNPQRLDVAAGEERRAILARRVDRPDRVDHPAGGKPASRSRRGLAGGETLRIALGAKAPASLQDRRAALPVDRTVDAASAEERGVGGM